MQPRNKIDDKYNNDPRHIRQWEMTVEWLEQFGIRWKYKDRETGIMDCGDRSGLTGMIENQFNTKIKNSFNDLNEMGITIYQYDTIFIFEVIEHLLNPLTFMYWVQYSLEKDGVIYLSTPINRPNWMRNKELHFHEFNYNELMHLIDKAGFKVVDEKIINPSVKWWTGFRPILRKFFGCGNNILLRLKRKIQ